MNFFNKKRLAFVFMILFCFLLAGLLGCSKEAMKAKHFERGEKYFSENKYREAIVEYKNVVQLDPKNADARYKLGLSHMRVGQFQEAFSEFSKCVELNQDQMDARVHLGNLYLLSGEKEKAKQQAKFVLAKDPDNVTPMAGMESGPAPWVIGMMWALATLVQFLVGWQYYLGAFKALRNGAANMDVLIAMGSSVAYFFSVAVVLGAVKSHVYFETAAVIITLIRLGKYLEARAKGRTSEAIKKLMGLRAQTARVERAGREFEVPVDEVRIGDLVIVRPGESFAADGVVVEGRSSVDESMLTGESMPVSEGQGNGCCNQAPLGSFTL